MFNINIFSKEFFKEYLSRNKYLILIASVLFIASVICGALFSDFFKDLASKIIKQMLESIELESVSQNAMTLFMNNITANLMIIGGGLIFSIISVMALVINGILIGYVFTLMNPFVFFVGVIPHGIFELPALILSLTGAFMITKIEFILIKSLFKGNFGIQKENIILCLKDLIFTVILSSVLIVVAAVIEAAVTPMLLNMVI